MDDLRDSLPCLKRTKSTDFSSDLRGDLKKELPEYLSRAAEFSPEGDVKSSDRGRKFWAFNASHLPCWFYVALLVAIYSPSSAAAERVFSRLRRCFGADNLNSLADYIEASLMWQVCALVDNCDFCTMFLCTFLYDFFPLTHCNSAMIPPDYSVAGQQKAYAHCCCKAGGGG